MLELLKPFWIAIGKWTTIAAGVIFMLIKIRQSGKDAVKVDSLEKTLQGLKTHDKIERNINTIDDDAINKLYEQELKRN